jgi:hypothetical protein
LSAPGMVPIYVRRALALVKTGAKVYLCETPPQLD